ncbi:MAG: SLOG family protein [Hominilimicola sp.]
MANSKIDVIKEKLDEKIENLIVRYDVKNFIAGGALGFDTVAAEAVIEMRKKYPHIKLCLYIPCYGQSRKWTNKQKYRYRLILSYADEVLYVTDKEYTEDCMQLRNMKMIRDSSFCITFCILSNSGTGLTLRNAEAVGIDIINIADEIYGN